MGAKQLRMSTLSDTDPLSQLFTVQQTAKPQQKISVLLAKFTSKLKFQQQFSILYKSHQLKLAQSMLTLFWHPQYQSQSVYWYSYLINFVNKLLEHKSMVFITTEQWRLALGLSEFLMLCCDDLLRDVLNSREFIQINTNDNDNEIKQEQLKNQNQYKIYKKPMNLTPVQSSLTQTQITQIRTQFRQFIYYGLFIKNKIVPNFTTSFTLINRILQSLYALYVKLQYNNLQRANLKRNININGYLLGLGIQYQNVPLIMMTVKFLLKIMRTYEQQPAMLNRIQLKPIQNHYFKQFSLKQCQNLPQNICLCLLHIIDKEMLNVNRQDVIKLLKLIIEIFSPKNKRIQAYIEKLSSREEGESVGVFGKLLKKYSSMELMKNSSKQQQQQNSNQNPSNAYNNRNKVHPKNELFQIQDITSQNNDNANNEQNRTQAQKPKSEQNQQLNTKNSVLIQHQHEDMTQIYNIYHQMVSKRFLPNTVQLIGNSNNNNNEESLGMMIMKQVEFQGKIIIPQQSNQGLAMRSQDDLSLQMIKVSSPMKKSVKKFHIQDME